MFEVLQYSLLASLCVLMIIAARGDILSFTISNKLNTVIACLAVPYWLSISHGFDSHFINIAKQQIIIAGITFFICNILFYFNAFGGGDVKMITALMMWIPASKVENAILIILLSGVFVSFVIMIKRLIDQTPDIKIPIRKVKLPYGVAIAAGGLFFAGQPFLNAFVK